MEKGYEKGNDYRKGGWEREKGKGELEGEKK